LKLRAFSQHVQYTSIYLYTTKIKSIINKITSVHKTNKNNMLSDTLFPLRFIYFPHELSASI
jgi:hypothetical protein